MRHRIARRHHGHLPTAVVMACGSPSEIVSSTDSGVHLHRGPWPPGPHIGPASLAAPLGQVNIVVIAGPLGRTPLPLTTPAGSPAPPTTAAPGHASNTTTTARDGPAYSSSAPPSALRCTATPADPSTNSSEPPTPAPPSRPYGSKARSNTPRQCCKSRIAAARDVLSVGVRHNLGVMRNLGVGGRFRFFRYAR